MNHTKRKSILEVITALIKSILIVDEEPDAIDYIIDAILSEIGNFKIIPLTIDLTDRIKPKLKNRIFIILDLMMPKQEDFKVFYDLQKDQKTKDIPI